MFKELKENMSKELKESMRMLSHQVANISKEIKIIKSNQIVMLELKSTITELKNLL